MVSKKWFHFSTFQRNNNLAAKSGTNGCYISTSNFKICWKQSCSTSNINGYFRQAQVIFPIEFSEAPTVVANIISGWRNSATEARATCKVVSVSKAGATIYIGDYAGQLANVNGMVSYVAIGK